jgi:hypothetical protein
MSSAAPGPIIGTPDAGERSERPVADLLLPSLARGPWAAATSTARRGAGAVVELADAVFAVPVLAHGSSCWTSPRSCRSSGDSPRVAAASSARTGPAQRRWRSAPTTSTPSRTSAAISPRPAHALAVERRPEVDRRLNPGWLCERHALHPRRRSAQSVRRRSCCSIGRTSKGSSRDRLAS